MKLRVTLEEIIPERNPTTVTFYVDASGFMAAIRKITKPRYAKGLRINRDYRIMKLERAE